MKSLTLILVFCYSLAANAQYPAVTIPGSSLRTIRSAIVADQEYELHILLPGNYHHSEQRYPVLYLMDSQWDFPLLKSIYGQQYYDGFIPEMIIVGVTWGGVQPNPDSLRARDYTPTRETRLPQSGGADRFLGFMQQELFPFMEKQYRVSNERILMGCSLGGLLTLYTWLMHSDLFTGYVAASPAVGWDQEVLYRFAQTYAAKKNLSSQKVYMTVGDVERGRPQFEKMAGWFSNQHYPQVQMVSKILEHTGHSGTKSETYTRGLQFMFERPRLKLPEALLDQYAGTYGFVNGSRVELKKEAGGLVLYFSPDNRYSLFAAAENRF